MGGIMIMRRVRFIGVASSALLLSGCATDQAFWDGLAMGLNAVAAETAYMAEEARCHRQMSISGEWVVFCPMAYAPGPHLTQPSPQYTPPPRHDARKRRSHRDRHDDRRRGDRSDDRD